MGGIGGFGGFSGFGGGAAAAAAGGDEGTESRSTRLCPAAAVHASCVALKKEARVSTACEQRGSCGRAVTRAPAWILVPGAWSLSLSSTFGRAGEAARDDGEGGMLGVLGHEEAAAFFEEVW